MAGEQKIEARPSCGEPTRRCGINQYIGTGDHEHEQTVTHVNAYWQGRMARESEVRAAWERAWVTDRQWLMGR